VAATFVAACTLPENSPVSRHSPIKLEQKVALYAANKIGRPLPGEMLLHDKPRLFTSGFHFSLCALLYSRLQNWLHLHVQPLKIALECMIVHTLLSNTIARLLTATEIMMEIDLLLGQIDMI